MESNEKQLGTLYEWPESSNPGRAYINIGVVPLTPGPGFTMQPTTHRQAKTDPYLTKINYHPGCENVFSQTPDLCGLLAHLTFTLKFATDSIVRTVLTSTNTL